MVDMARKMGIIGLLLLLATSGFALAADPPSGLDATLASMVTNGYDAIYSNRGWSSLYDLPQTRFSLDEADFYDNAADFGETGMYGLALRQLANPEYDPFGISEDVETQTKKLGANILPWIWVPDTEDFGTADGALMPNGGLAYVRPEVHGIVVTDNQCRDATLPYNEYSIPIDTVNKIPFSNLQGIAGTGIALLNAAQKDETNRDSYLRIAERMGTLILDSMITPEGETFGFHPNEIMDKYDKSIPIGMVPYQFALKTTGEDTLSCGDGGTIKLNENRKTYLALAGVFLQHLHAQTGEEKFERGANYISEAILSQLQCDGSFVDYTRWEGPGIYSYVCKPTDGSAEYEAYPSNVAVSQTQGWIIDSALILNLLRLKDDTIYVSDKEYKRSVHYFLELEETETGSGFTRNGDPIKYASYSLDIQNRAYGQVLLANVFLRASCQENDSGIESRLQTKAYQLINGANTVVPAELDYKIGSAFIGDPGLHAYALSAAADSWKIITRGCEDCRDNDGDGYIDGGCAGDIVKYDCNDNDASIHPGAEEVCDMVDNDCDGVVDNGFDFDGDGYSVCSEPADCNDDESDIYPGAPEIIDQKDNDCNLIPDDTGVQIHVTNDLNAGIGNVDILLVDYGNACINAFSDLVGSFDLIRNKCTIVKTCTTDENGSCLMSLTNSGKFQALGVVGDKGLESGPIEFSPGGRNEVSLQAKGFDDSAVDQNDSRLANNPSLLESNPYLGLGLLVVVLIILGLGGLYMHKTGRLGAKGKGNSSPSALATPKKGFSFPKITLPKIPKVKISVEPEKKGKVLGKSDGKK
ncbi:MAG: putative metal-binding motif-containing protein [Candidatus Diapherotrites archaeon]|nr:putative metal-binding motif-containing protein [Candidatus Diapherotrites archaeon]MDZ4256796.1 putative metal-binding motif-containing protein [archaeon]